MRRRLMRGTCRILLASLLAAAVPEGPVLAESVSFSGWTHQRFSLLGGNTWRQGGRDLSVQSNAAVSLLWTALPDQFRNARTAAWSWSVDQGVPATDLSQKGGEDRNLSVYTIFAPPDAAAAAGRAGIRRLLDNPDVRVLMYVWGGAHRRGDVIPSPFLGARGKTIVLRPSGTGRHDERVDLRADLQRAFGRSNLALVGLAVSADSDDTGGQIRARLGPLSLHD